MPSTLVACPLARRFAARYALGITIACFNYMMMQGYDKEHEFIACQGFIHTS